MKMKSMVQAQTSVVKGEMLQSAWPLTTSAYASVISVQAEQGIPPSDLQNNSWSLIWALTITYHLETYQKSNSMV